MGGSWRGCRLKIRESYGGGCRNVWAGKGGISHASPSKRVAELLWKMGCKSWGDGRSGCYGCRGFGSQKKGAVKANLKSPTMGAGGARCRGWSGWWGARCRKRRPSQWKGECGARHWETGKKGKNLRRKMKRPAQERHPSSCQHDHKRREEEGEDG